MTINFTHNLTCSFLLSVLLLSCNGQKPSQQATNSNDTVKPFFSEKSFWNQPIGDNPKIDANSDKWINMLSEEPSGEKFSTVFKKWTIPVYEVKDSTPYVVVKNYKLTDEDKELWVTVKERNTYGHGPGFNPVPIPKSATPDIENDAHFSVIDKKRNLAWDMWGLNRLDDGSWESKTGMFYRLDGDGVFNGEALGYIDDESVHFHGPSRASGVPTIAGLIRYDEVASGKINHKLSCATRYAAKQMFAYPASWTDGNIEGGIPQGAVIQLDPNLDLSKFNLTKEEVIVAKALQEYGMVVVDIAQGQPLYAEGLWGHPNKSWEGKLHEWEDKGINTIDYKHYRVLEVINPSNRGDTRTSLPSFKKNW